jgi:hypothetical protein
MEAAKDEVPGRLLRDCWILSSSKDLAASPKIKMRVYKDKILVDGKPI